MVDADKLPLIAQLAVLEDNHIDDATVEALAFVANIDGTLLFVAVNPPLNVIVAIPVEAVGDVPVAIVINPH